MHSHGLLPPLTAQTGKHHCSTKYNTMALSAWIHKCVSMRLPGRCAETESVVHHHHVTRFGSFDPLSAKKKKKRLLEDADAYLKDNMQIKWTQLTTLEHIILRIILILKQLFYTVFHMARELLDSC